MKTDWNEDGDGHGRNVSGGRQAGQSVCHLAQFTIDNLIVCQGPVNIAARADRCDSVCKSLSQLLPAAIDCLCKIKNCIPFHAAMMTMTKAREAAEKGEKGGGYKSTHQYCHILRA